MENGTQDQLTLRRMPDGGFIVSCADYLNGGLVFAATGIDEALAFLKDKITPVPMSVEAIGFLQDRPLEATLEEGGQWIPFQKCKGRGIHAIKFASGRVLDSYNGWRK